MSSIRNPSALKTHINPTDHTISMAYDIRKLQLHLLDILQATDKAIRQHGLRYYLTGGTLLGAVRHGGFIPWDDDADIAMPRPDYEVFLRHANEWLPPHLVLRSHLSDPDYPFYYAKIEDTRTTIVEGPTRPYTGGIFIDIFPIDGIPDSQHSFKKSNLKFRRYCKLLHFLHRDPYKHGKGPRSWWPLFLRKIYTRQAASQALNSHIGRLGYDSCRIVGCYSPNYETMVDREKVYGEGTPIRFEGVELMGMRDNNAYLRKQYGDFMKLPPEDKRFNHAFLKVDFNNSYLETKPNTKSTPTQ